MYVFVNNLNVAAKSRCEKVAAKNDISCSEQFWGVFFHPHLVRLIIGQQSHTMRSPICLPIDMSKAT
jgi:hypothetical protein